MDHLNRKEIMPGPQQQGKESDEGVPTAPYPPMSASHPAQLLSLRSSLSSSPHYSSHFNARSTSTESAPLPSVRSDVSVDDVANSNSGIVGPRRPSLSDNERKSLLEFFIRLTLQGFNSALIK